jgi:hypothetical protein
MVAMFMVLYGMSFYYGYLNNGFVAVLVVANYMNV